MLQIWSNIWYFESLVDKYRKTRTSSPNRRRKYIYFHDIRPNRTNIEINNSEEDKMKMMHEKWRGYAHVKETKGKGSSCIGNDGCDEKSEYFKRNEIATQLRGLLNCWVWRLLTLTAMYLFSGTKSSLYARQLKADEVLRIVSIVDSPLVVYYSSTLRRIEL